MKDFLIRVFVVKLDTDVPFYQQAVRAALHVGEPIFLFKVSDGTKFAVVIDLNLFGDVVFIFFFICLDVGSKIRVTPVPVERRNGDKSNMADLIGVFCDVEIAQTALFKIMDVSMLTRNGYTFSVRGTSLPKS